MFVWTVEHPEHEKVKVEADTRLNAITTAARLWGVPWTSVARDCRTDAIEKLADIRELLPAAKGGAREVLEVEERRLDNEEQEIVVRLTAAGAALTPEEQEQLDDIQKKKVEINRARLNAIRQMRMDINERLPLEKKAAAAKLKKRDAELAAEEEEIVAALTEAGVLPDEPPDEE